LATFCNSGAVRVTDLPFISNAALHHFRNFEKLNKTFETRCEQKLVYIIVIIVLKISQFYGRDNLRGNNADVGQTMATSRSQPVTACHRAPTTLAGVNIVGWLVVIGFGVTIWQARHRE
jgi:hypothetical protein